MADRAVRLDGNQQKRRIVRRRERLDPENKALLAFLKEWMSTPDEMGDEWWDEFEKELKANRLSFDRQ